MFSSILLVALYPYVMNNGTNITYTCEGNLPSVQILDSSTLRVCLRKYSVSEKKLDASVPINHKYYYSFHRRH